MPDGSNPRADEPQDVEHHRQQLRMQIQQLQQHQAIQPPVVHMDPQFQQATFYTIPPPADSYLFSPPAGSPAAYISHQVGYSGYAPSYNQAYGQGPPIAPASMYSTMSGVYGPGVWHTQYPGAVAVQAATVTNTPNMPPGAQHGSGIAGVGDVQRYFACL